MSFSLYWTCAVVPNRKRALTIEEITGMVLSPVIPQNRKKKRKYSLSWSLQRPVLLTYHLFSPPNSRSTFLHLHRIRWKVDILWGPFNPSHSMILRSYDSLYRGDVTQRTDMICKRLHHNVLELQPWFTDCCWHRWKLLW